MTIRKACYHDLHVIRQLPLQFTGKPVSGILLKQFRVIVLDARVQALVVQEGQTITGFLALRPYICRGLSGRLMAIVHLAVTERAVVHELLKQAEKLAADQLCDGLLVQEAQLPRYAAAVYKQLGYEPLAGTLSKTLIASYEEN